MILRVVIGKVHNRCFYKVFYTLHVAKVATTIVLSLTGL
jgi:hypothetical protein